MSRNPYRNSARWYDTFVGPVTNDLRAIGLRMFPTKEGVLVLDVGCGTGTLLDLYQQTGCRVFGIDASPAMLEVARGKLGHNADLRLGAATRMPYGNGRFDLVTIVLALKVKAKAQLGGSVVGAALSLLVLIIWPDSVAAVWIATAAYGLSLAGLFPGSITLASEHLHLTGGVTGLFLVGSSLGAMTVPWLIGQFFESVGPRVFPLFLTAVILAGMVLLVVILLLLRRRDPDSPPLLS